MPAADFAALNAALPGVSFEDGSQVLRRARAVKTSAEIERLKHAGRAAEAGLVAMASVIEPGASLAALSAVWKAGAQAYAAESGFHSPVTGTIFPSGPIFLTCPQLSRPGR